jgi:hypothetical protein
MRARQYGFLQDGRQLPWKGVTLMEVYQALSLMLMFGMFVVAMLAYLKKK